LTRNVKSVIKRGRSGTTHFVLLASNGRVVVTSETYESKESCIKGIAAVKRLAAHANVIEADPTSPTKATNGATTAPKTTSRPDSRPRPIHGHATSAPAIRIRAHTARPRSPSTYPFEHPISALRKPAPPAASALHAGPLSNVP
jgi:uncharacterized protein YegP (UPF0339 family)